MAFKRAFKRRRSENLPQTPMIRFSLDVRFQTVTEKEAFIARLSRVRDSFSPEVGEKVHNYELLSQLFSLAETRQLSQQSPDTVTTESCSTINMLGSNGVYTGDTSPDDQELFVCERRAFTDLCQGLVRPCGCWHSTLWELESRVQKGHVLHAQFRCRRCQKSRQTWTSSRFFGGRYLVNQKLVHAFTCAGILPRQYLNFTEFANLGTVGKKYIKQVYTTMGYRQTVQDVAEHSMKAAVEEVTGGEWVITDARHDSTRNAFHTTVPCLSGSSHKVVGISTVSRKEHPIAQTRELECTRQVIPQVQKRGLTITEVAHDCQAQVSKYVVQELALQNSYDTWHGTKNAFKAIGKVCKGKVRSEGKTWFRELSDKKRSTKIHLYYCMKNCGGDAEVLQSKILSIVNHYQGIHTECLAESSCRKPGYECSKVQLTSPPAKEAYCKALKKCSIYRHANFYSRCRDTYWVESFNHMLLTYLPKRVHFGTDNFVMRLYLAVLDWNENVGRAATSERLVQDLRRPDRRTPMKVLVKKTFTYVNALWTAHVQKNLLSLIPCEVESHLSEESPEDEPEDGDVLDESILDEDVEDDVDTDEDDQDV